MDKVEEVAKIMAQAHPAESLGNIAREIIAKLESAAPKPQETTWIPIDLLFRDRYSGKIRNDPRMLVEVVKHGNEVLFQSADNGTHRMVALEHIENTRTPL